MRLKPKEVKLHREKLLIKQGSYCPLCETRIQSGQDTLDHNHQTGHCRMVLCRNCNQIEGRVLSWIKRNYGDNVQWLRNLLRYWETDYRDQPFHPNHLSDIEKQIKKVQKRMRKCKTERGKQKNKDLINKLKEQL